jgi:peptidoglycan/xylan/chitin deacetylase (PgdA/CDA1 family)
VKLLRRLKSVVNRFRRSRPKPLILTYHRIADDPVDHWCLAVSPANFEEHLEVLRRTRYPLPLADFLRHLAAGSLRPDAVAVTFDDGYVDNLDAGKPRLAAADVPATVFIATGFVGREFWWDELARLILLEKAPNGFQLIIAGKRMHFELGGEPPAPAAPLTKRTAALMTIWQTVRPLDEGARESLLAELRLIFTNQSGHPTRSRAMTPEEVRKISADGLVTIGAHTITHPLLSALDAAGCDCEIKGSKLACEALIGRPVEGFAYPYGDFDAKARAAVRTAGFVFACSTRYGPATTSSDVFALPRIHVSNWDGDAFEQVLRSASAAATD